MDQHSSLRRGIRNAILPSLLFWALLASLVLLIVRA
jgi:hypothetical protein